MALPPLEPQETICPTLIDFLDFSKISVIWSSIIFLIVCFTLDRAKANPASPPHKSQATLPGLGYPSSPELNPVAFLSTSWREKKEYILFTVSSDNDSPFTI